MARCLSIVLSLVTLGACEDRSPARPSDAHRTPPPETTQSSAEQPLNEDPLAPVLHLAVEPPVMNDGTYRVDPFVAAYAYSLLTQAQGRPWFEATPPHETPRGYKVASDLGGTPFSALGLKRDDVVEELNGVPLTELSALAPALAGSLHEVRLTISRSGVSSTHSYRFVGGLAWTKLLERFAPAPSLHEPVPVPVPAPAAMPLPPESPPASANKPPQPRKSTPSPPRPAATPRSSVSSPTPPPVTSPRSAASGVKCPSQGRCTLPKAVLDRIVANPNLLQTEVRIAPAIRNDVFSGYWIRGFTPGSAVGDLGFRAGDKITHVNGKALADDAQALALYLSLSNTRSFTIRYERDGKPLTKVVAVQ